MRIYYYLKNQSEQFCPPQVLKTDDIDEFMQALDTIRKCGYKIVKIEGTIINI